MKEQHLNVLLTDMWIIYQTCHESKSLGFFEQVEVFEAFWPGRAVEHAGRI
jgi:hypothetical protein